MPQDRIYFDAGADNYLDLIGLYNRIDASYPTDATVTVSIYNRLGVIVTGTLNLPAAFVSGTVAPTTAYRVFIQDTIVMPLGLYEIRGTASRAGVVWKFYVPLTVQKG